MDDNTLSVYIRRLREKIEEQPSRPEHLLTVRGMGYRWEGEAMRLMYDKQNRKYLMLIGLFCLALAVSCLSAGILQGPVVRDSLFEWEKTTASSLLGTGSGRRSLVAEAFHCERDYAGGRAPGRAGSVIHRRIHRRLFPEARNGSAADRCAMHAFGMRNVWRQLILLSDDIFVS